MSSTPLENVSALSQRQSNDELLTAEVSIVDLAFTPPIRELLASTATPAEHERVRRFATADLGLRWLAAQRAAKHIIARRFGVPVRSIGLGSDDAGRPIVVGAACNVSISKSDRWGAVAIGPSAIGVDIELGKPMPEAALMATRFLHASDAAAICSADNPERTFYRAWVRLEAVLKRKGTGFDGAPPPAVLDLAPRSVSDLDLSGIATDVRLYGAISAALEHGPHQGRVPVSDEVLPFLARVQTVDEVLGITG